MPSSPQSSGDSIVVSMCGQDFRLALEGEDAGHVETLASAVEDRINQKKMQGANGLLRAALMTCLETAYELDELDQKLEEATSHSLEDLETAEKAMDRLIARLDTHLAQRDKLKAAQVIEESSDEGSGDEESADEEDGEEDSGEEDTGEEEDKSDLFTHLEENKTSEPASPANVTLDKRRRRKKRR